MDANELNPEQVYEWFIISAKKRVTAGREFIVVTFGCVGVGTYITAQNRFRVLPDLNNTVLLSIMERTGYKNNGSNQHPITHFKHGTHVFAKPVKNYRAGDINDVMWSLAPDTITGQRAGVQLSQKDIESITRVTSTSPDTSEAIRRLSKTDPELLFRFGQAVGAGVLDKNGKVVA